MFCATTDLHNIRIVISLKIDKPWRVYNMAATDISSTSSLAELVVTPRISDACISIPVVLSAALAAKDDAVAVTARYIKWLFIHKHLDKDWRRSLLYGGVVDTQLSQSIRSHWVHQTIGSNEDWMILTTCHLADRNVERATLWLGISQLLWVMPEAQLPISIIAPAIDLCNFSYHFLTHWLVFALVMGWLSLWLLCRDGRSTKWSSRFCHLLLVGNSIRATHVSSMLWLLLFLLGIRWASPLNVLFVELASWKKSLVLLVSHLHMAITCLHLLMKVIESLICTKIYILFELLLYC